MLKPQAMEMLMRGTDLFRDPAVDFDGAVRKLAEEFQCPRVVAERCMAHIVEAAVDVATYIGAVA